MGLMSFKLVKQYDGGLFLISIPIAISSLSFDRALETRRTLEFQSCFP